MTLWPFGQNNFISKLPKLECSKSIQTLCKLLAFVTVCPILKAEIAFPIFKTPLASGIVFCPTTGGIIRSISIGSTIPVKTFVSPKQIVELAADVPVKSGWEGTWTYILISFVETHPFTSVTTKSTLYIPGVVKLFETVWPVAVVPSPNVHSNVEVAFDWA